MEISVIGGGHGCYAAAAELSDKGHNVRLWRQNKQALKTIIASGKIKLTDYQGTREVRIARPTTELREAIAGAIIVGNDEFSNSGS